MADITGARTRTVRIGAVGFAVADDEGAFWDRAEAGRWEPGTLAVLERHARPGAVVLDLGAWVGPVALTAAARGAEVVAVEADPAALALLRANLAANPALADRVEVVAGAVSAAPGIVRLGARRKPGDSMSSTLLAEAGARWDAPAVTPADLAARLPAGAPLLVKLDIEGGEYALLPALGPLLERPGAALLVSLHPAIARAAGHADPVAVALAALGRLAEWRSAAVGEAGPRPCRVDRESLAACETWLFERPS